METMDSHIDTVTGYIYDNDKIVTYKWLSKEVKIHVNVAKRVLSNFWDKYKKQGDIECTFLIMGTLKDGGMRVEVVKEANLADAKHKFDQILSEHIYSVQKALPDLELLAISGEGDVKYSAIKCNESIERTHDELSILRWGFTNPNIPKTISKEAPSKDDKQKQETEVPVETEKLEPPLKQLKTSDKKVSNNKKSTITAKGGFHNLFGKAINQPKISPESSPPVDKNQLASEERNSKITKASSENQSCSSTNQNAHDSKSKEPTRKEITNMETQDNPKTTVKEEIKKKPSYRGTKRNRNKETAKASSKKRRRIIEMNSSESETSDINNEDDEIMESPPPPKDIPVKKSPSPEKVKIENGKRKVLKIVNQTYEEDGFLVSKKVHVYESCSEDETETATVSNNPPPKAPPKNPEPRKKEAKSKKNVSDSKQTTLMSFFKKS